MTLISDAIFYIFVFMSVYVQVFFFVTFLENRKKIITRKGQIKLTEYPAVTIVVPCWNEEKTVYKTVHSLLSLNYPKNKIEILLIDDGSTDNTWEVIRQFAKYPNIKVFHKENGGKYTALNLGLANSDTEFFGCLDADSFANSESLVRIMSYFEKDDSIMAVAPSVVVNSAKGFIQNVQKVEYSMGVYFKKMLGFLGAINVTPGPLTVFRRKVFEDLGPYRHGHNTEDMEIAYRMQKNQYKIEHCNDAYVFTNVPPTLRKLYRQRLRWVYGFINNTFDYRNVLFRKKYGNFSLFTLPVGVISIFSVSYLFCKIIYSLFNFLSLKILVFNTIGLHLTTRFFHPDPFFINTETSVFMVIFVYILVIFSMIFGKKMIERRWSFSPAMFYFFPIFAVISPFWLLRAIYNTILSRKPAWR